MSVIIDKIYYDLLYDPGTRTQSQAQEGGLPA